jgi:hypothetical protein
MGRRAPLVAGVGRHIKKKMQQQKQKIDEKKKNGKS